MGRVERLAKYVAGAPGCGPVPKFSNDSGASLRGDEETFRRRILFKVCVVVSAEVGKRGFWSKRDVTALEDRSSLVDCLEATSIVIC